MKKNTKKQIIVIPTTQKNIQKTKPTKTLSKPRSARSKENTLAYYNCLIDQVANPLNEKVKITAMTHQCKYNKGKVAQISKAEKQWLIQQVAQNYLNFGKSLGTLLHTDITCNCKK